MQQETPQFNQITHLVSLQFLILCVVLVFTQRICLYTDTETFWIHLLVRLDLIMFHLSEHPMRNSLGIRWKKDSDKSQAYNDDTLPVIALLHWFWLRWRSRYMYAWRKHYEGRLRNFGAEDNFRLLQLCL